MTRAVGDERLAVTIGWGLGGGLVILGSTTR